VTVSVRCPRDHDFEADASLAGGITNCPRCGLASSVPGLNDPFWRVLQVLAALLWVGATWGAFVLGGPVWAVGVAVVLAGLLWLVSRAF
jgi:hypothetical protein